MFFLTECSVARYTNTRKVSWYPHAKNDTIPPFFSIDTFIKKTFSVCAASVWECDATRRGQFRKRLPSFLGLWTRNMKRMWCSLLANLFSSHSDSSRVYRDTSDKIRFLIGISDLIYSYHANRMYCIYIYKSKRTSVFITLATVILVWTCMICKGWCCTERRSLIGKISPDSANRTTTRSPEGYYFR